VIQREEARQKNLGFYRIAAWPQSIGSSCFS
jgi:hypothetical protein